MGQHSSLLTGTRALYREGDVATKIPHISLAPDRELLARLKAAAERQGISIEDLCIQALENELALEESGTDPSDIFVQLLALTRRRRQLESRTIRRKPNATDYVRDGRGHLDAIDLVSGDELEAYREREYARLAGEIRAPTEQEKEGSLKALEQLARTRERLFQGRTLPGNSADLIREAREEYSEYLDQTNGSSGRRQPRG